MAEALAQWVLADIVPAIEHSEAGLVRLQVNTSYESRPRNHVESAPTSEHGTGTVRHDHPVMRRDYVETFSRVLADNMHRAVTGQSRASSSSTVLSHKPYRGRCLPIDGYKSTDAIRSGSALAVEMRN